MEFPARVTLLSGAIVLLSNSSQMEALPLGVAFEKEDTSDLALRMLEAGLHRYREVQPSMAGEAKRLRVELQAAADALAVAADAVRNSGHLPLKASQTKQAADRAKAALEETVDA